MRCSGPPTAWRILDPGVGKEGIAVREILFEFENVLILGFILGLEDSGLPTVVAIAVSVNLLLFSSIPNQNGC